MALPPEQQVRVFGSAEEVPRLNRHGFPRVAVLNPHSRLRLVVTGLRRAKEGNEENEGRTESNTRTFVLFVILCSTMDCADDADPFDCTSPEWRLGSIAATSHLRAVVGYQLFVISFFEIRALAPPNNQ